MVAGYGCNESFFDEQAGDRITPDQHYQNSIDAFISAQGAFIPLQDYMPKLIMLDGLRSDMLDVTPNADAYLNDINNQVFTADNPFVDPSDLYKVIINVNEVLANIDVIEERDRDYDELVSTTFRGALTGLRAWSYLTLVKLYNKAAYFEDNMTTLPATLSQNVLSKEEIIEKLIEQLKEYTDKETDLTDFINPPHYMNNKALLGELYLEQGNYNEAVNYLKLACESFLNQASIYKVDVSYRDAAWSTIFLNAESQGGENMSVVPYSRAENQFNPLANWMGHNFQFMVKPTTALIDSFMAQATLDGQQGDIWRGKGVTFDADTLAWITDSTFILEPFIKKYLIDSNDPSSSDIIISRAADIHLLLAEAYNRLGDETSQNYALMLLNQGVNATNPKPPIFTRWSSNIGIRGRVYLKSKEIPDRDSISQEDLTLLIEDYIIQERAMELAFEGKRWFDLVRVAERRNQPEFLADKVAAKFEGTSRYNEIHAKLMNPANWYLPFE